ncbi:hypothetical protein [uncultured Sphingobium sp.]|uniref:hypothetical protein n=1 Tax=uncultured Sphingobium sp. TaxID=316087 RepID=UPI002590EC41|nr:hypothetical protein [uncultured Sphingobium sp.]
MFPNPKSLILTMRYALGLMTLALLAAGVMLATDRVHLSPSAISWLSLTAVAVLFPALLVAFPRSRRSDLLAATLILVIVAGGARIATGDIAGLGDMSAMMILIVAINLSSGIDILRQRARRYPNELFEVIAIEEKRARRRGDARRASPTVRPENAVKMNQIG